MFCPFSRTTPRTAQFVVMSGRKMPSAVYSEGTDFFRKMCIRDRASSCSNDRLSAAMAFHTGGFTTCSMQDIRVRTRSLM